MTAGCCVDGAGEKLNELQIPSPMGGRWSSMNVADIAVRLKLREKPVRVPRELLQARVNAIWKAHPNCTGQQVLEMLKPEHPICLARAWALRWNSVGSENTEGDMASVHQAQPEAASDWKTYLRCVTLIAAGGSGHGARLAGP
jgi:hypothetical protein